MVRTDFIVLKNWIPLFCFGVSAFLNGACHSYSKEQEDWGEIRHSIFRIKVVSQNPNFKSPWKKFPTRQSSGTGFYIGDGQIMTNAHVVSQAKFISVQRQGDSKPIPARVMHIAHDCDLALITVDEKDYFSNIEPLKIGKTPRLRSPVSAIGYPTGGEQVSITEGIVSRIGFRQYSHSGFQRHLLLQVDSAINPGNSGGPVIQNGYVIGVAFQGHTEAENTGYIIPPPILNRFLEDIADGRYDGHPIDGLSIQEDAMSNSQSAEYWGLKSEGIGILVSDIDPFVPLKGKLIANDILLKIDDYDIGMDARVDYEGERVHFKAIYDLKQIGESVRFRVLRNGKNHDFTFAIDKSNPHYDPGRMYPLMPRYLIYSGLVFSVLSKNYLENWGHKWMQSAPVHLRYFHENVEFEPEFNDRPEIILLVNRLPNLANAYSLHQDHQILKSLNGLEVKSLEDLAAALDHSKEKYLTFEFFNAVEPIVMPRKLSKEYHQATLDHYKIEQDHWFHQPLDVDGATGGKI